MHNRYFPGWDGKTDTPAGRYYAAITEAKDEYRAATRGLREAYEAACEPHHQVLQEKMVAAQNAQHSEQLRLTQAMAAPSDDDFVDYDDGPVCGVCEYPLPRAGADCPQCTA
jgi:hypothetical protein